MSITPTSSSPILPGLAAMPMSAAPASTTSATPDAAVHRTSGAGAATVGGRRVRFSENVLREVLASYGLQDPVALLEAALRLDDGNHYLKRSELEKAAESLAGGGEITLPADRLPAGMGAGDPITLTLRHDVNEEARRKAEITSRLLGLRSSSPPDPGGTIIL